MSSKSLAVRAQAPSKLELEMVSSILGEHVHEITPAVERKVRLKIRQASREYDRLMAEAGLGPRGIIVQLPKTQTTGNGLKKGGKL